MSRHVLSDACREAARQVRRGAKARALVEERHPTRFPYYATVRPVTPANDPNPFDTPEVFNRSSIAAAPHQESPQ